MKKGGGKNKGSSFEREICKVLSEWWSGEPDRDVFWRSTNSGGRATIRGRAGKATVGHYGDIAAVSEEGTAFLRMFTLELKCGYNKAGLLDGLDALEGSKPAGTLLFIQQAMEAQRQAGSRHWMVIHRRTRKRTLVAMPWEAFRELRQWGGFGSAWSKGCRWAKLRFPVGGAWLSVGVCSLEDWLDGCAREQVESVLK